MDFHTAERHLYPESRLAGVYLITNKVNGKVYVGSAQGFKHRIQVHASRLRRGQHHSWKLQRDFNVFGEQAFDVRVLLLCERKDLLMFEQRAIDKLRAVDHGYNVSEEAGAPMRGRKHSEEARAKMSASRIGNTNARGNKGVKRKPFTDEHRRNLSMAHTGYVWSAEAKKKLSASLSGRAAVPQHSEESKAKMSAAHKVIQSQRMQHPFAGKTHSAETKARMSAARKGKPKSEETRARMRAAQARRREARLLTASQGTSTSKPSIDGAAIPSLP